MRHKDWESRLNAVLVDHRDRAGQWGGSDCWILSMSAYEAVTGRVLLPHLRGYASERAGFRLFAKDGFLTVGDALASALPPVGRYLARRGDLAVIEREGLESCGVVTAMGLAVKTLYGDPSTGDIERAALEYYSLSAIKNAFRVD